MKILLIQPKEIHVRTKQVVVSIPLGLCYLASPLRQKGHKVEILDCLAERYTHREKRNGKYVYGLPDNEILERIKAFGPQLIGVSSRFSKQAEATDDLCRVIKQNLPNIPIVTGGMHATVNTESLLADGNVDFVLQGEADFTLTDLADSLENKSDYSQIHGLGYKTSEGQIIVKEKGTKNFIPDLDSIPFPARDLLKMDIYYKVGLTRGMDVTSKKNVNVITSRGCPAKCSFCTIRTVWGRKFRSRSPENVLAELEQLKNQFGAKHIQFEDDNLTHDIPRAKELFKGMIDKKLNLKFDTPNGVSLWRMDKPTLKLMKEAGCNAVTFAVESGSQRVLYEVIKKPQNLDKVVPLIGYARKVGLKVGAFFVVGFPHETKAEIEETFKFPYKVKLDSINVNRAMPYSETDLRHQALEGGWLTEHEDPMLGTGLISTPNFTAQWLTDKIRKENMLYLFHLLTHRPWWYLSKTGRTTLWNNISTSTLYYRLKMNFVMKAKGDGHKTVDTIEITNL